MFISDSIFWFLDSTEFVPNYLKLWPCLTWTFQNYFRYILLILVWTSFCLSPLQHRLNKAIRVQWTNSLSCSINQSEMICVNMLEAAIKLWSGNAFPFFFFFFQSSTVQYWTVASVSCPELTGMTPGVVFWCSSSAAGCQHVVCQRWSSTYHWCVVIWVTVYSYQLEAV